MQRIDPLQRAVQMTMARFGGDAELVVSEGEVYDPETSTSTATEVRYPIRVTVLNYIKKGDGNTTETNNLIRTGDKQIMIQAYDGLPIPEAQVNYVVFKGTRYTLIVVKDYDMSGNGAIVYETFGRA